MFIRPSKYGLRNKNTIRRWKCDYDKKILINGYSLNKRKNWEISRIKIPSEFRKAPLFKDGETVKNVVYRYRSCRLGISQHPTSNCICEPGGKCRSQFLTGYDKFTQEDVNLGKFLKMNHCGVTDDNYNIDLPIFVDFPNPLSFVLTDRYRGHGYMNKYKHRMEKRYKSNKRRQELREYNKHEILRVKK